MSNLNPGGLTRVLNYIKTWVTGLLNGKANSSHNHTTSQITDFPAYGNTAGTICQGNDSRLSDARTPTSHTHTKSQITDFPTIPTNTSQLTNDSGFITGIAWGSVTGKPSTFTPSSHTHTKSQITDFPSLATVATSGSYNDLTDRSVLTVNGATSLGWSGIGGVANGSTLQLRTTDNTSPSICFHRSGHSHVVLAEAGGALGIQAQGSNWLELATKSWVTNQGYITTNGAAYPRRVGGVTMNFNWSGQGGQPTWLWGGEDGTNMYVYNPANFSVNYATNSGYTNWLRTSSHTDHLFHTEWDGSYFWTYVTAGDGGYRAVRVERSNSSGYADSAGSVAWGNVSDRPWAVSQFTNDIGFITSGSLMYINGDRAHNAYRIVYGSFNNLNNISTGRCWVSFPSAFSSAPTVVMTISNPDGLYNYQISTTTTTGFIAEIWDGSGNRTGNGVAGTYIAIGNS